MKLLRYCNLIFLQQILFIMVHVMSDSDVRAGYLVTLAVPTERIPGFVGRAYLLETDATMASSMMPGFRVALSVEDYIAGNGSYSYSCSLQVFLGDVRVWDSGHYSPFEVSDTCAIELTVDGDLQLKGLEGRVGWRTGTRGQGVEMLRILRMGNLVLVDTEDNIKWQSFNFPTNVMLYGQRLDVATRLTSFPSDSRSFHYSFEIQENKIALFLNFGKLKYSYWEFKPSKERNITFVELGPKGLGLFNHTGHKIAQISPNPNPDPSIGSREARSPRFMSLNNRTGNLGLFYYSPGFSKFEARFQALNTTCDLPMACKPYGICTFSNSCSCIRDVNNKECNNEEITTTKGFCEGGVAEMVALDGVTSVIKDDFTKRDNLSKDQCKDTCLRDCNCVASLFVRGECHFYGIMVGVKQVDDRVKEEGLSYFVKFRKGRSGSHGKSGLKKWVLVLIGVVDGLIVLVVIGGVSCYSTLKRRIGLLGASDT